MIRRQMRLVGAKLRKAIYVTGQVQWHLYPPVGVKPRQLVEFFKQEQSHKELSSLPGLLKQNIVPSQPRPVKLLTPTVLHRPI